MMVDLYMKDGRTTFRFRQRGTAVGVMKRKPEQLDADSNVSVHAWARWRPGDGFEPARVQLISANSVSMVMQVDQAERATFLAQHGTAAERGLDEAEPAEAAA
jgi:hypothetical protein